MFCVFCRCTIILLESNLNSTALAKSERKRDKQKVFYAFLMKVMAATSVFQFSTTHTDLISKRLEFGNFITYILFYFSSPTSSKTIVLLKVPMSIGLTV